MSITIERAKQIKIQDLIANPWNTNTVDKGGGAALARSLDEFGQYRDLVVRPHPDVPGKFQILGGYHRAEALRRCGEAIAHCTVLHDISDSQAKKLGLIDNGRYWEDDPDALQELVLELEAAEGEDVLLDLPPTLLAFDLDYESEDDDDDGDMGRGRGRGGLVDDDDEDDARRFIFSAPLTRTEYLEVQGIKTKLKIRSDEALLKKLLEWAKEGGKIG